MVCGEPGDRSVSVFSPNALVDTISGGKGDVLTSISQLQTRGSVGLLSTLFLLANLEKFPLKFSPTTCELSVNFSRAQLLVLVFDLATFQLPPCLNFLSTSGHT